MLSRILHVDVLFLSFGSSARLHFLTNKKLYFSEKMTFTGRLDHPQVLTNNIEPKRTMSAYPYYWADCQFATSMPNLAPKVNLLAAFYQWQLPKQIWGSFFRTCLLVIRNFRGAYYARHRNVLHLTGIVRAKTELRRDIARNCYDSYENDDDQLYLHIINAPCNTLHFLCSGNPYGFVNLLGGGG